MIVQTVPGAYSVMLFLGAVYLAWLGYQLLKTVPGRRSEHSAIARSRIAYALSFVALMLVVEYGLIGSVEKRAIGWKQVY